MNKGGKEVANQRLPSNTREGSCGRWREVSVGNFMNRVKVTKNSMAEVLFIYRSFSLDLKESRIFNGSDGVE